MGNANQLARDILALPRGELARVLEALVGQPVVAASGWRVVERRLSVPRLPERNARIVQLSERGLRAGQIARLEGMTRGAVLKVLHRAKSVDTQRMSTPGHGYDSVRRTTGT